MTHVLDPVLAAFDPLSRRKDGVEDVFLLGSVIHRGHNTLSLRRCQRQGVQMGVTTTQERKPTKSMLKRPDLQPKEFLNSKLMSIPDAI